MDSIDDTNAADAQPESCKITIGEEKDQGQQAASWKEVARDSGWESKWQR